MTLIFACTKFVVENIENILSLAPSPCLLFISFNIPSCPAFLPSPSVFVPFWLTLFTRSTRNTYRTTSYFVSTVESACGVCVYGTSKSTYCIRAHTVLVCYKSEFVLPQVFGSQQKCSCSVHCAFTWLRVAIHIVVCVGRCQWRRSIPFDMFHKLCCC